MVCFRRFVGQHAESGLCRDPSRPLSGPRSLRGIFLTRRKELDWFYQYGASEIFPDFWERYRDEIPEDERGDFMTAYYKRLTSDDEETQLSAARAWSVWEGSTSKLYPSQDLMDHWEDEHEALSLARIECHYFMNNSFFPTENYLLENVG